MTENKSLQALFRPGDASDFFEVSDLGNLDPEHSGYSRSNVLWLSEFSRLIYRQDSTEVHRPDDFATRDKVLKARKWAEAEFFKAEGTQAALFVSEATQCAALVFRGTLGLADLITDLEFIPEPWIVGGGLIHRGFRVALENVWSAIQTRLENCPYPVFITGHSLGAALATVASSRILLEGKVRAPAALYTYGSPRVGDAEFVSSLRSLYHCRVVNDNDTVPTVPPPILFQHDGETHHIRHDGRIEVRPRGQDVILTRRPALLAERSASALNGLYTGIMAFGLELPEPLTDHAPVNYTAHLEAAG